MTAFYNLHATNAAPPCAGCAPLYRIPQTRWTKKLFWQMAVYVTWIVGSMFAGGFIPWYLDTHTTQSVAEAWKASVASLPPSNYTFCPKDPVYSYSEFARAAA